MYNRCTSDESKAHKVEKVYISQTRKPDSQRTYFSLSAISVPRSFATLLFHDRRRIYRRRKFGIGASRREAETDCDAKQNRSGARRMARSVTSKRAGTKANSCVACRKLSRGSNGSLCDNQPKFDEQWKVDAIEVDANFAPRAPYRMNFSLIIISRRNFYGLH